MKPFLLALQFLTAITLKSDLRADARDLARSAAFFPLVGLVIGIILAACWYFSLKLWPPIVADALVVLVLVAVTRAFHLDGLADTLDGVLGGSSRARALEIMKDTRLGAFGVMGIVLDLLLKFVALTSIPPYMKMQALVLFPVISRYSIVQLAWRTPSARAKEGLGAHFQELIQFHYLAVAFLIGFIVSFGLLKDKGLICLGVIVAATLGYRLLFRWKLGGVTGDVFGFVNECNEILFLLTFSALVKYIV